MSGRRSAYELGLLFDQSIYRFPNLGVVSEVIDIYHQFRFFSGREYAVSVIQVTLPAYFI